MPDGATHLRYLKAAALPIVGVYVVLEIVHPNWWPYLGSAVFWYWTTRYFDPDLDQISITSAEGRMMRELPFIGFFMTAWWTLYAGIMNLVLGKGAHRSWLTHSILPGTIFRAIWFWLPYSILGYFLLGKGVNIFGPWLQPVLVGQLISWGLADLIHITLDRIKGDT